MAEENKSEEVSGSLSGNLNAPQTIEEKKRTLRIAKCLQGEPVCVLNERLAPHSGIGDLRKWATGVLKVFGEKAVNFEIGEIICDERSIKNSFAHGLNPFKVEAVRSIKDVIEQGVVFAQTKVGREEHYFIAAPVVIENKEDIVTILAKRDMNTQRMYIHSVATKESILNKDFSQNKTPETLVPSADTEVSERSGKLYSGDIGRILQNYLKVNIPELEIELNQQIEQQKGNKMDEQQQQTSEKMDSKNPQQFVQDTIAQYPAPTILHNLDNGFGEPFVRIYFSENPLLHKNQILSIRAADKIFAKLDEMVEREKAADEYRTADKVDFAVISQNRQFNGVGQERYDLGDSNGGLFGLLSENPKYHDLALHMTNYLTADERLGLLDRTDKQIEVDNNYAMAYPEVKEARMAMIANRGVFFERLQQQILQQDKTVEQQQRQPENIMTEAEEHHFFIDRTMAAYPLQSGEPYVLLGRIPNKYGYSEDEYLKMSVSAADIIYRHLNKAAANEVGEISIGAMDGNDNVLFGYKLYIGKFPDEGLWSQFAADKYHHSDLAYLSSFLSTEQRQDLLKELSAEPLYPLHNPQAVADRNEFVVRFAEQMQQDKTVEQHLSEMVDEVVAIANRHNQEQSQVESVSGNLKDEVKAIHQELAAQSLEFQFTHKGLADRSAAFNQELLQLAPEQLKELQPFFEQHKAIQTLQGLYEQTNDTARLEEINEHNRLLEWKIHNKVEAYLGKHIDYSDMNYYKNIKTGEELRQMMNEKQPENEVSALSQSVSSSPEPETAPQSQPQVDEPKNFVQNQDNVNQIPSNSANNLTKNQETPQNLIDNSFKGDISSPEIFQEKVMFAKVEETQITQMIDEIAKSRTYLAVDFDNKDAAKAAGAKYDPQAKGWYAEEITPELRQFLPQQPENITAERKALSDFQRQAETIGLDMANFKEVFGSWQRVPIKGKGKTNADGGYKLYRNDDGSIGACAKNYSTGDSVAWNDRLKDGKQIQSKVPLPDYLANQKQKEWNTVAQHTAQSNVAAMRGEVAANAYHQLQPALATDPYIQNKGISDIGKLKRLNDGSTIVPLYHNGKIANLQMIRPNGEKRLMSQAAKVGAYYSIGNTKTPQAVIVAEGVATADSVHQIASEIYGKDKVLVLAAIDSGNLHNVAAKVEQAFPQTEKLIAADNDAHNATRSELKFKNAGLDKANEVKEAYPNFQVALCPALTDEKGSVKNTDWNDFLKAHGKAEAVKAFAQNDKYIAQQKATTLPETEFGVSQNSKGSSMGGRE